MAQPFLTDAARADSAKSLKAPFAAKFGMHLGFLTVFSDPVHDHVRPQAQAAWERAGL